MNNRVVIAIDGMGGDKAPKVVIEGMALSHKKNSNLYFKLFGDREKLLPILKNCPKLEGNYELIHTESFIKGEDKPADALRKGKESSMRLAINCVESKEAVALVSAGNTGALMAMSKFVLGTIKGIDRPAIVTCIPTRKKDCVIMDLGANVQCTKEHLLQFAIMGSAFAKAVVGIENPRIALLNIGEEALKGNDLVKAAAELMKGNSSLNYVGFAEGDDLFSGDFDVIVTDGFTGNIALKVLEGTVKFMAYKIKNIFQGFISKISLVFLGMFSFLGIRKLYLEINPSNYNGAMFIGVEGVSIKSHGSADKRAFSNAILIASKLATNGVNDKIKKELYSLVNN